MRPRLSPGSARGERLENRLDFEDLPLVQGDQEGSKRLRPKSRVGRIRLVGWDPSRTSVLRASLSLQHACPILPDLDQRESTLLTPSLRRKGSPLKTGYFLHGYGQVFETSALFGPGKGDEPLGFRRRAPGGKRLENRLGFWIYPCKGEKGKKKRGRDRRISRLAGFSYGWSGASP